MLLHIVARGKIARSPEAELVDRYIKRIAWPTRLTELPDSGGSIPPLPGNSVTIALDERGETLSSAAFAKKLEGWRDNGKREARFLIGAADGHDMAIRDGADLLYSFGPATWRVERPLAITIWSAIDDLPASGIDTISTAWSSSSD